MTTPINSEGLPARGGRRTVCPHCGPLGAMEEHGLECPRYPNSKRLDAQAEKVARALFEGHELRRQALPYYAPARRFEDERAVWMPRARDAIAALKASLPTPAVEEGLLDQLARNTNLELTWGEINGDLSECAWQVHRRNGGRNDREWTLLATGETPREALVKAISGKDGE